MKGIPLPAQQLVERMSEAELERLRRLYEILPAIKEAAAEADDKGEFPKGHVSLLSDSGLLGLIVPEKFGGLGGGLRDLCAATYSLATCCPSTALCFFFHCSSASRGLLALKGLQAGLFTAEETPKVRDFAEKILFKMGRDGLWLANFASEAPKSEQSAITIATIARSVPGGFLLNGEKSFGCSTGVADEYLVTAKLERFENAEGLATFFVARDANGVRPRRRWDAIGLRASATHGLTLKDVFVPEEDSLAIPGAFTRMISMSRGSFVGNQIAGIAVYLGAAQAVFDFVLQYLRSQTFRDTGRMLGESPMHQELVGKMAKDLETAYLWLRRQLELETAEPPLLSKDQVVQKWRLAKGEITEACFQVAQNGLKACGTSNTGNTGPIARALRDLSMGLVQAFPCERGRLEVAKALVSGQTQQQF